MTIKQKNRLIFLIYALILGAFIGLLTWIFLRSISFGTEMIWSYLPAKIDFIYLPILICMIGGVFVGLCQKYFGNVPGVLSIELEEIKKTKRVDYKNLPAVAISSFLPLIFGASAGPEAALVSIIGGLSTWIADHIKATADTVKAFTEIGAAATLGAMFGSPFFGYAKTFEERKGSNLLSTQSDKTKEIVIEMDDEIFPKNAKRIIYFAAALAGFGTFAVLSYFFPESGIYRYEYMPYGLNEWLLLLPLAVVGGLFGNLYYISGIFIRKGIQPIKNHKVLLAVAGGFVLGAVGMILPYTMFSGEAQIAEIFAEWTSLSVIVLILTAILKIFVTRFCFLTGWRGGHIFPIIFSGLVLGYAAASLLPADPTFCALVCSAAMTCMVLRKPVAIVFLFLVICPIHYLIPLGIAAFIGILMPFPKIFEHAEEEEIAEELKRMKRAA